MTFKTQTVEVEFTKGGNRYNYLVPKNLAFSDRIVKGNEVVLFSHYDNRNTSFGLCIGRITEVHATPRTNATKSIVDVLPNDALLEAERYNSEVKEKVKLMKDLAELTEYAEKLIKTETTLNTLRSSLAAISDPKIASTVQAMDSIREQLASKGGM